jgi:hypothetical protein
VADPFASALVALVEAGVEFVVVGVGGVNFYARDASQVVVTADLDLLLPRRADALRPALAALAAAGFSFEAGGEPFLDVEDEAVLANVARAGDSLVARSEEGAHVDLMLSMTGFAFGDLAVDAVPFRVGDLDVRVGRLEKLLRSKELSGRPKDVEFLRMYAARVAEERGEG